MSGVFPLCAQYDYFPLNVYSGVTPIHKNGSNGLSGVSHLTNAPTSVPKPDTDVRSVTDSVMPPVPSSTIVPKLPKSDANVAMSTSISGMIALIFNKQSFPNSSHDNKNFLLLEHLRLVAWTN